jgi:hypothetical protein
MRGRVSLTLYVLRSILNILISSYSNSDTKEFEAIAQAARRKLEIMKAAVSIRICFFWKDAYAHEVEIVDYHP